MKSKLLILLITTLFFSCSNSHKNNKQNEEEEIELKYATKFKLFKGSDYYRVQILDKTKVIDDFKVSENPGSEEIIKLPFKNCVTTSTTHIGYLLELGLREKLIGFPSTHLISDSILHSKVVNKEIVELGTAETINVERLLELNPDVLIDFPNPVVGSKRSIIKKSGVKLINITEFYEEEALGKVEWLKLFGLLFGKFDQAVEEFNTIEQSYNSLLNMKMDLTPKPVVFSGIVFGDSWYAPGGNSFTAKFYKFAGADYVWKNNTNTGSITMSFEKVFNDAISADYWIGVGGVKSLAELVEYNPKHKHFKAFKESNVYSVYGGEKEWGANPYFESGVIRPDLILADYIRIFNGTDNSDNLVYLKKLK